MTLISKPTCFVCSLICSSFFFLGCGPNKAALQKKIDDLETRVSQLKTERVNLAARTAALDDKVVVLKSKLDHCRQDSSPLLHVVKLSPEIPDDEEDSQIVNSSPETPENENGHNLSRFTVKEDPKRPRLVIDGAPAAGYQPAMTSFKTSEGNYLGFEADSLGVVDQEKTETEGGTDAFQQAYLAYSNRQYQSALTGFSEMIRANPQDAYADNAVFWRGECYLALGDFFRAIGEFERLLRRYPESEMAPSTLYRIGFAYDKLRDRSKAVEYYFQVVDRYPGSDAARRASRRVSAIEGNGERSSKPLPTAVKR